MIICITIIISACNQDSNLGTVQGQNEDRGQNREVSASLPGGAGSTSTQPFPSFIKPVSNLPQSTKALFYAGQALAKQPWVKAPTVTHARDGLGPLYNARSCLGCHRNGGRGQVSGDETFTLKAAIIRISLPGEDAHLGVVPEPIYGEQIQTRSIALSYQFKQNNAPISNDPPPEAEVILNWHMITDTYPDGDQIHLRFPKTEIRNLSYGNLHPKTLTSLRNAPPLLGVGLIELIPQRDINALADPHDSDQNHISGRINQVWDQDTNQTVPGRFGLKANRPANLRTVTAAAFIGDIGISNPLFPKQPCTALQDKCNKTVNGNDEEGVELPQTLVDLVADYSRNLGVPKRRRYQPKKLEKGKTIFNAIGCQSCHHSDYTTSKSAHLPHLSQQHIWPYSDFLLHDMGPDLADGRSDFQATGSEWRTAPLWGVGLSEKVNGAGNFLHDGRARNIEEAIWWHGGESDHVKRRFINLSKTDRQSLIHFVESL